MLICMCNYVLWVLCLTCCECLFLYMCACVHKCVRVRVLLCVVYEYVYVCVCILLYLCTCVYMCTCMCTCVFVYQRVCMIACYSDTDSLVKSEPGNRRFKPDPNSCLLCTRYTGDSKIDIRDDSEIRNGSCSEDQTTIQIQNRVISCEYFFCIIINYRYLLLNYCHIQILVVHVNYYSWPCSLRWYL